MTKNNLEISGDTITASPKKPKRTLKPGMGKSKGSSFEGTIAKKLSAALTPLKFMRSPGSGARVGGKNFETFGKMIGEEALKLFTSDVVPVNEKEVGLKFNFSVECKFYKTADTFPSLVSKTANVFKWMNESIIDAIKVNRLPILIFKWNHTQIFVACLTGDIKFKPNITLIQGGQSIDIFYLDALLEDPKLWVETVL